MGRHNRRPVRDYDPTDASLFFIESTKLELNGKSITTLGQDMTLNDFTEAYTQFQLVAGSVFTPFSNSVQMKAFNKNFFFASYDLTNNAEAFETLFVPSQRIGFYSFEVKFSQGTTRPLTMIMMTEFPSTIAIYRDGRVIKSFTVWNYLLYALCIS